MIIRHAIRHAILSPIQPLCVLDSKCYPMMHLKDTKEKYNMIKGKHIYKGTKVLAFKAKVPHYLPQAQATHPWCPDCWGGSPDRVRLLISSSHSQNNKTGLLPPRYPSVEICCTRNGRPVNPVCSQAVLLLVLYFLLKHWSLKLCTAGLKFLNLILKRVIEEHFQCRGSFWDTRNNSQWYFNKQATCETNISCPLWCKKKA